MGRLMLNVSIGTMPSLPIEERRRYWKRHIAIGQARLANPDAPRSSVTGFFPLVLALCAILSFGGMMIGAASGMLHVYVEYASAFLIVPIIGILYLAMPLPRKFTQCVLPFFCLYSEDIPVLDYSRDTEIDAILDIRRSASKPLIGISIVVIFLLASASMSQVLRTIAIIYGSLFSAVITYTLYCVFSEYRKQVGLNNSSSILQMRRALRMYSVYWLSFIYLILFLAGAYSALLALPVYYEWHDNPHLPLILETVRTHCRSISLPFVIMAASVSVAVLAGPVLASLGVARTRFYVVSAGVLTVILALPISFPVKLVIILSYALVLTVYPHWKLLPTYRRLGTVVICFCGCLVAYALSTSLHAFGVLALSAHGMIVAYLTSVFVDLCMPSENSDSRSQGGCLGFRYSPTASVDVNKDIMPVVNAQSNRHAKRSHSVHSVGHRIEVYASGFGPEWVRYDEQMASWKFTVFGGTHKIVREENGQKAVYRITVRSGMVYGKVTVKKNGDVIYTNC